MKIFKMNDCDWVAAKTLEEAKLCLAKQMANGVVDEKFEEEFLDCPYELSEEDTERLKFVDENGKTTRSFKIELLRRINGGEEFPQHFASTEC